MDKNYKYDYICFTYFREKLNLKKYEVLLEQKGIIPYKKENVNERISPYFSFLNEGNTDSFTIEEKEQFDRLFSNDLNFLLNNEEATKFIESTYQKYYFSNIKEKYKFFVPGNYNFMAPTDAITFGINYQKFYEENDDFDEEKMFEQEGIIFDVINEIQEKVSEETGVKIAVLEYNELAINQPFMSL